MSVYFSKYCVNGSRDSVAGGDPHMRDRLLAAIRELAALGPGQLQSPQASQLLKTSSQRRLLDSSRPKGSSDSPKVHRSQTSSPRLSRLKQSNPHGVLKEKLKRSVTLKLEKGNIKVYANILHPDVQFTTLGITFQTTSKELVSSILKKYNAQYKDPNLYYVAMETGIKHKDSGLPISKMIVLEDDARPLELQACQPQGEAKFHLRVKSGGVVRVRISILCPESSYKTVYIARNTTSRQLIELIVNGSGTDENPDDFTLREASSDFDVDQILEDDEYPLEIQTKWKPNEGRFFFLTRRKKKPDSNPVKNSPEITSEELRNDIARQNQTIDTMNETIQRLQLKQGINTGNSQDIFTSNCSSNDDYDKIDDMNQHTPNNQGVSKHIRFNDIEERPNVRNKSKQSTLTSALDLHNARSESQNRFAVSKSGRPPMSQINNLRRSFYRKKSFDDSDLELLRKTKLEKTISKNIECSSQIGKFRHNFLKYYNIRNGKNLHRPISRSWSTSDAEYYDIAKNLASVAEVLDERQKSLTDSDNYPNYRELETVLSRNSSFNSLCDGEIRRVFENAQIHKQELSSSKTLYDVIIDMELVAVTLKREPGKELGLELTHVTQTGSPIDNPSEVMYVFHKRDGNTAIVGSPTSLLSEEDVIDYENEVDDVFAESPSELSQESHVCFGSQNDLSSHRDSPKPFDDAVTGNTNQETKEPGSPAGSCCSLVEWREGNGPKPHHGVRIVGVTTGSIAENTKKLEKGDVIVEVNGINVLNSSLDVVIDVLRQHNTVNLVVARQKQESLCHVTAANTTTVASHPSSDHEDMQEQMKELVAKLAEMKETLHKKDKYISHLKKSLMKRKLKLTSKEKIEEGVQVIV